MKARKRPQRARRAAVRRRDIAPGPTPQTAAKLRRDVLLHLYEKGRLRREHLEAAEEIRRIWQAFSRSLGATATNPDTLATGRQGARARQPIEGLTGGEEAIWRNRLQLVLDIVVDNRSFRQVEGCYRMRHGAAAAHLQTALHLYARIAGWVGDDS